MAADTREDGSPQRPKADSVRQDPSTRTHEVYETFNKRPPNANMIPGGATNTAGGRPKQVSVVEAAKTVQLGDFKSVHRLPCTRDSFLTGIVAAFGLGGTRAIIGAPTLQVAHWAVWGGSLSAWMMYEYCCYHRRKEMDGIKRVTEILDLKKAEKKEKMALERKAKEDADKDKLAEDQVQQKKQSKSWIFW